MAIDIKYKGEGLLTGTDAMPVISSPSVNRFQGKKLSVLGDSISTYGSIDSNGLAANTNTKMPVGNAVYYSGRDNGVHAWNEIWWKE